MMQLSQHIEFIFGSSFSGEPCGLGMINKVSGDMEV
jgi:hypothetical protein